MHKSLNEAAFFYLGQTAAELEQTEEGSVKKG